MVGSRVQLRRVAIALGASAAMVVLIAALLPRAYLVNDDPGFVLYLRLGMFTPWMSSVLNWVLVALYRLGDLPWYGLFLYALIVATGAVLIHSCLELVDQRPGVGRVATLLGAMVLAASHAILAIGVTWTTVSISAMGTSLVAFVAYLETCRATGSRASPWRAAIYGALFVAGFALREVAIAAVGAAVLPVLVWVGFGFLRRRYFPRAAAVIAFLAPTAFVFAVQGRISQAQDVDHEAFNQQRGRISGAAAFASLETRAPDLLARAGWTVEEYRDFSTWLLADDTEFSTEKVTRLADTNGVPTSLGLAEGADVLRGVVSDSAASVWLFLTAIAGGLVLAWLGVIDRRRGVVFSLGYLLFLMVVPVVIAAMSRFPQRVSLSFYTVAAFGMFAILAGEIAARPPRTDGTRRGGRAVLVISLFMFVWARDLLVWSDRDRWPYHPELHAFAERVTARHGMVMEGIGTAEMDPLLVDPRGYDALPSGWATFTAPWFEYIERFGIHSGHEFLRKMVDNPDAYMVATPYGHDVFEEWIGRRLHDPSIRMSLVDTAAGMPTMLRSELYRLVTTPLVRGSDEWNMLKHNLALFTDEMPGPPDVSERTFRSIAFTAPYDRYILPFRDASRTPTVEPVDGGIRFTVGGGQAYPCTSIGDPGEHAGIELPVHGLAAARFDLTLVEPENLTGVLVIAETADNRSIRWRWGLDPATQQFGFSGPVTLVPGFSAHQLVFAGSTASAEDIRELRVIVSVKNGSHAGFELRRVAVSEP